MMRPNMLALINSEVWRLSRSRQAQAFVLAAFALMLVTVCSSSDEQDALLFMVAGDNPNRVGGAIGFIGNLIDGNDVAGSAARTSMVFTILWIPLVIVYAVAVTSHDYVSASYDVAKARGISDISLAIAKCATHGALICLCFVVFSGISFICKFIQYAGVVSWEGMSRFAVPAALGAILLAVLFVETFSLFHLTRSAIAASVVSIVLSLLVLALFPSAYGDGTGPWSPLLYLSPVFYLMNVCALCFRSVGASEALSYSAIAAFAAMLVSVGALKVREAL